MIFILPLVQLCQWEIYAPFTFPVGDTVDSFPEMDDGSIILSYKEVVYQAYERKGVIRLECDKNMYPGKPSNFSEQVFADDSSQYSATFIPKCVCKGGFPDAPGGKSDPEEAEDSIQAVN